jgi:hypothetical protein
MVIDFLQRVKHASQDSNLNSFIFLIITIAGEIPPIGGTKGVGSTSPGGGVA